MKRRRVLATAALTAGSLAGCLAERPSSQPTDTPRNTETPTPAHTPELGPLPTPTGTCGTAATPQSAQFDADGGDSPACFDGAEPSLAIENEREAELAVTVEIESENGETVLETEHALDSGERVVEQRVLTAQEDYTAIVTVEGEAPETGAWTGTSCYRHGISITPGGVEFGLVSPLSGPGDTQHDCYAGDPAPISISTRADAHTVTVTVVDHCTGDVVERTAEVAVNDGERISDVIVNGGVYDLVFAVEDGPVETFSYDDLCWGLWAGIDEAGKLTVHQTPID